MRNRIFSLLLLVFFVLGVGIFLLPQTGISVTEKRNLAVDSDISAEAFASGSLTADIENVLKVKCTPNSVHN